MLLYWLMSNRNRPDMRRSFYAWDQLTVIRMYRQPKPQIFGECYYFTGARIRDITLENVL